MDLTANFLCGSYTASCFDTYLYPRGTTVGVYDATGITALGEALRANGALTALHLSRNQIGAAGGAAISTALEVNGALTELNLLDNELCGVDWRGTGTYTGEGISAIADALRGKTVLLSTHIMSEVDRLCDDVAIIHEGRLLLVGTKDEVIERGGGSSVEDIFFQLVPVDEGTAGDSM